MDVTSSIICFLTDEDEHQEQNSKDENIVKQDLAVSNALYISPGHHDYSKSSITFCSHNKKCDRTEINTRQLPSQMSEEFEGPKHVDGGMAKLVGISGWQMLYKNGDLFTCPVNHALAHCISSDCHMGAGIAALFKKKFGRVDDLLAQQKQAGECAVLRISERFVYYLVTKNKYSQKPTYTNLRRSLVAMREHCLAHGVSCVSMPRIGCGLDKLQWGNVSSIITEVFKNTKVRITVYTL